MGTVTAARLRVEQMPRASLLRATATVIALRLAWGVIGLVALGAGPVSYVGEQWHQLRITGVSAWWWLVAPWQQWDGLWFQHIAMSGYRAREGDAAFFPLFPLAERVLSWGIGGQLELSGLIVATVAYVAALVLLHRLVSIDLDGVIARRTVVLLALSPEAFFFLAPFSESLFLALSVGSVLAARRRMWGAAGVCALLAAGTRSAGVLLVVPLAVEAIADARARRRERQPPVLLGHGVILAPIAGLVLYWAYVAIALGITGGPLSAAGAWGQHVAAPWSVVWSSVQTVLKGDHPEEIANLASALAVVVAVPFMWRRLPLSYTAYAVAMVPLLCFRTAATSPLMSTARYAIVVFPFFVLLARFAGNAWIRWPLYAGFAAAQLALFVMYSRAMFIG